MTMNQLLGVLRHVKHGVYAVMETNGWELLVTAQEVGISFVYMKVVVELYHKLYTNENNYIITVCNYQQKN